MTTRFKGLKAQVLATTSVAAVSLAMGAGLSAPAAAQDEGVEERIVVTGSRIVRRDFNASSPIVTIESDTFENQSQVGIEATLNRLPQFNPGENQFTPGNVEPGATSSPGTATLNLRGLGSNRSLVLINGRRAQPANASLSIDVNTIPAAAIDSVEIISGGASAVYGADAIAGVVNFILSDDFEGFEFDAQYGITEEGDGDEVQLSALLGATLDDGRGNAMVGASFAQRSAVYSRDREFFVNGWTDTGTSGGFGSLGSYDGIAMYDSFSFSSGGIVPIDQNAVNCLFAGDTSVATGDPACTFAGKGFASGDVTSGTFAVNADGTVFSPRPSVSGVGAPGYTGELGARYKILTQGPDAGFLDQENNIEDEFASLPLTRYGLFSNSYYDLTDSVTAFLQTSYTTTRTRTNIGAAPSVQFWGTDVPYDDTHPVPAELAYLLDNRSVIVPPRAGAPDNDEPAPRWNLRQDTFVGPRSLANTTDTFQVLAGLRGDFAFKDWTWEVYGSHGETRNIADFDRGWVSQRRLQRVIDAPFYGRLSGPDGIEGNADDTTFAVDAANPTPGFNGTCTSGLYDAIFNDALPSQDCIDLISMRMKALTEITQDIVEANIQGGLFELPAGEVRFAAGAGYRGNDFMFLPDANADRSSIVEFPVGLFGSDEAIGSTDVAEVYGELLVPVIADAPLIDMLEVELGYRYSDYDTAGGVDTYKTLGNWTVNDWLTIRGGYQRATRAPNIAELFTGQAQEVVGIAGDPCATSFDEGYGVGDENTDATDRANAGTLCGFLINPVIPGTYDPNAYAGFFANGPFTIDVTQGNAGLEPEVADTITLGAVINSPFDNNLLSGVTVAVDYYDIDIENAIQVVTSSISYEQCFNAGGASNPAFATAGATGQELFDGNPFCANIQRETGTGFNRVAAAPFDNLGGIKTSGVDLQVDWIADVADIGFASVPGAVSVNFVMNYLDRFELQALSGAAFVDYAGTTGNGTTGGAQFDYKAFTTVGYALDDWNLGLRWRHLPEIDNVDTVNNPATSILATDSYDQFDLFGRYSLNETVELRGGVDNLLDTDPNIVGAQPGIDNASGITNGALYDTLGRRFFVGATMRY